jgi:isopenicillin N synthase-like dioxygenase
MEKLSTEKLRVEILYPDTLKDTVNDSTIAWKHFCSLPQSVKDALGFSNFGGYEKKHGENGDQKELLHYTKSAKNLFVDFAAKQEKEHADIILELVNVSERVLDESLEVIDGFLKTAERDLGQDDLRESALRAKEQYVLRYLHYLPIENAAEEIAAAHCDIGGFTLHLAEDLPGLQYLDGDMQWKHVNFDGTKTIIFPGIGMQHRTKSAVVATCHRVVSTPQSQAVGRYSSVLFGNWPGAGRWNKEKYGSMSAQTPGFNYTIDHEEMAKYFDDQKDLSSV